ncbi:MAG: L-fucose:H+ symporter permease [Bacteroidetes bacterium]|nr:L-fucose:H+ symporter permease [Bacteroidota bacterium]
MANLPESNHRLISKGLLLPFILVTALFFLWGIPNNLNDVLIKQFMKSFELSRFQAGLIQSAFYMGYFILAMPAALVMKKYGYKTGLVCGLLLYSIGCLLFWPAAVVGKYEVFLLALFVIASGLAFLETGANPFITLLGDPGSSERRLNFSQAFNPIGSITGVLIGTLFIFSGIEHDSARIATMKLSGEYLTYLHHETMRVVTPYLVLAAVTILMALLIMLVHFPRIEEGRDDRAHPGPQKFSALFRFPHFVKGVVAQFFYVGAQVGTWSYFIQYVQDYTGQNEKIAGYFLTGTLVAFMLGRFSATFLMRFIKPSKLMGIYSLTNILLVGLAILLPGWIGVWSIFLTSFFMSLMFPTIFALGLKGLGPYTKIGGSMIVMAIIGGAFWTPVMGLIAESMKSMAIAMMIPLCGYIYISWYAFSGCKPGGNLYHSDIKTSNI